jgi:hypothetical protein
MNHLLGELTSAGTVNPLLTKDTIRPVRKSSGGNFSQMETHNLNFGMGGVGWQVVVQIALCSRNLGLGERSSLSV